MNIQKDIPIALNLLWDKWLGITNNKLEATNTRKYMVIKF